MPVTNKVYIWENPEVPSAQRGFLLIGHIFQHTVFINGGPVKIYDCVYAHNLTLSEGRNASVLFQISAAVPDILREAVHKLAKASFNDDVPVINEYASQRFEM